MANFRCQTYLRIHNFSETLTMLSSISAARRRLRPETVNIKRHQKVGTLYNTALCVLRHVVLSSMLHLTTACLCVYCLVLFTRPCGEYPIQFLCVCLCFQRILFANRSPLLVNRSNSNLVESQKIPTSQSHLNVGLFGRGV